jgi:hypothetical protein
MKRERTFNIGDRVRLSSESVGIIESYDEISHSWGVRFEGGSFEWHKGYALARCEG